ncbi:MAG: hypothetical protein QXE31_02290 [Candidatus Woesearchaeota archaeon]
MNYADVILFVGETLDAKSLSKLENRLKSKGLDYVGNKNYVTPEGICVIKYDFENGRSLYLYYVNETQQSSMIKRAKRYY